MALPQLNLDALRNVPASQKAALLFLLVGGMIAGFYFYIVEPKTETITALEAEGNQAIAAILATADPGNKTVAPSGGVSFNAVFS